MPAIQSCFIEPIWDQFEGLLPKRDDGHRLGCHRPRVADRLIFDKLVQVAVYGCATGASRPRLLGHHPRLRRTNGSRSG